MQKAPFKSIATAFLEVTDLHQAHLKQLLNLIPQKHGNKSDKARFEKSVLLSGYCCLIYETFSRFLQDVEIVSEGKTSRRAVSLPMFLKHNKEISGFLNHEDLDEMRSIRNICRHGFGAALNRMREKRPELFKDPTRKPVWGYQLLLEESDLDKYIEAIKHFVHKLEELLEI